MSEDIKKRDESQEAVVKLQYPIQLPDRVLTEITMRRPKLKDIVKFDIKPESSAKKMAEYVAHLCKGVNYSDLEDMDSMDYEELAAQMLRFREPVSK